MACWTSATHLLTLVLAVAAGKDAGRSEGPVATTLETSARPASAAEAADGPDAAWGLARWGLSPDEVLAAFQGKAAPLTPEVRLADGNVVAVAIDAFRWEGVDFKVRFVFEGGRLALVSLRTPPQTYADAERFIRLRDVLARRWGAPLQDAEDDQFIDLRQVRWDRGAFLLDLKYIPGVVAMIIHPPAPR